MGKQGAAGMSKWIVILGIVCMSSSVVFIRHSTAPSMVLALYRMLISVLFLLPAVLGRRRGEWKQLTARDVRRLAAAGLCFGLHFFFYFESLKHTSIGASVMLCSTEIFFVAVAAWLLLGEYIGPKGRIGIGVTFAGCVVVALAQGVDGQNVWYGNVLALLAAIAAAGFTLLGRKSRSTISNSLYTMIVYSFASLTLLGGCLTTGVELTGYDPMNLWIALGMAVLCTTLGHSLLTWGLRYETASFISSAKMLTPVCSILFGWTMLGEAPPVLVMAGSAIIIGGILYYFRHCADRRVAVSHGQQQKTQEGKAA